MGRSVLRRRSPVPERTAQNPAHGSSQVVVLFFTKSGTESSGRGGNGETQEENRDVPDACPPPLVCVWLQHNIIHDFEAGPGRLLLPESLPPEQSPTVGKRAESGRRSARGIVYGASPL